MYCLSPLIDMLLQQCNENWEPLFVVIYGLHIKQAIKNRLAMQDVNVPWYKINSEALEPLEYLGHCLLS